VRLLARAMRRLRRAFLPDLLDECRALLAQDALHAADCVSLPVEEMADAAQQVDVVRPIVAPATAALHRLDLVETRFPESQNVLRQIELVGDLADGAKR